MDEGWISSFLDLVLVASMLGGVVALVLLVMEIVFSSVSSPGKPRLSRILTFLRGSQQEKEVVEPEDE